MEGDMAMTHKPATKAYRDRQRARLMSFGVDGHQLVEQLVVNLMHCGYRPREAWRLASELTQDEVAARFNQMRGDPNLRMRGSRICEYEKWPKTGVRPSMRALKILAAIYETTWDRLVDVDDLERMPAGDRQEFLDISELRYGDSLDAPMPRQASCHRSTAADADSPVNRLVTGRRSINISSAGGLLERPEGGLIGEVTHFTGRERPMAELRAGIAERVSQGSVATIYAIDGMAGVGKTAFARHAARELVKRYADGMVWVDLYGHTPGMQPRDPFAALEQLLLQLGVPPEAIKADPVARQGQWRNQIYGRRMLIVLDNALTSDQVLPLLPEAPGCLVLVTSRRKLTGLTDAYPIPLAMLERDEAERLFIKLVGERRCENRDAVRQIVAACGRLPLAIRLIAGRLRHHRDELLGDVAADFSDQTLALDALVAEHLSVRSAFEWSYRLLSDTQRRAFRLLSWHPGPQITAMVICAVADVPPIQGRRLLRELVDHNLLEQLSVAGIPGGPRYRMHDLVRLYARERADAEESSIERLAAVDRLTASYLAITREADRLLRPYVAGDPHKGTSATAALTFADASQARIWLTAERLNLLACVRVLSPTAEAADLTTVLAVHFRDFGFWSDVRYLYGQALAIYRQLGDQHGQVNALWGLGEVERRIGDYVQARKYHTEALTMARRLGYRHGEAEALRGLGEVERLVGEYDQARMYYGQALALDRDLGYRRGEILALWGLGHVARLAGAYGQAGNYCNEALTLARGLGYRRGEILGLWGLGQVEQLVGDYDQAREYHTQALSLARLLGDRPGEVQALWGLGEVERLVGDYGQAREYHSQALTLARQLGDRPGEGNALRGLGEVERLVGDYGQARECYSQALTLARQLGDRPGEVDALRGLAHVERLVGEYGPAREHYERGLLLAQRLGYRSGEVLALWGLGQVDRLVGKYCEARELHAQALVLSRDLGDRPGEILALRGLGQVERLVGDYGQAREYHMKALVLARHLGDRRAEVLALRELGKLEQLIGDYRRSREYHSQALILARQPGYPLGEVLALRGLGEVARLVGDSTQAGEYLTQALTLARQLGDRRGEAEALWALGLVASDNADCNRASELWQEVLAIYEKLGVPCAETVRAAMCQLNY
jgi:tetratricopeptide (TPR) repeat protein/transcriptional regulator with XRE-family HTH domain